MRFFVPGEEDADAAWERMRQACGASVDNRPLYSITCEDEGTEVVTTVGEEGVVAIICLRCKRPGPPSGSPRARSG